MCRLRKKKWAKRIISICDKEIIGKKFSEKNKQLDLSSNFYKGEEKTEEEVRELVKDAYILNIVGECSIEFCLKERWISKNNIIRIKKMPHAQCLFITD